MPKKQQTDWEKAARALCRHVGRRFGFGGRKSIPTNHLEHLFTLPLPPRGNVLILIRQGPILVVRATR